MLTRRMFVAAAPVALLAACARPEEVTRAATADLPPPPPMPVRYGAIADEPYPVPAVPDGIVPPQFWRQEIESPFPNLAVPEADLPVGTVVVDADANFLYLIQQDGKALRYGVGTGAAAYAWSGEARMQWKQKWPRWKAPDSMIARRPEFAPYSVANGGMAPGPGNPLGARALYLFQNGEDTLYRIHGACEPQYVGKAVSSGCIRLLDQDAIDLYDRVREGARVIVLPSTKPAGLASLY